MGKDNEITVGGRVYVTVEEAAVLAGRSSVTIRRWAQAGKVRTKMVLRRKVFDVKDVEKEAKARQ